MKVREAGEKLSEQKNDHRAIDHLKKHRAPRVAALDSFPKGQRYCHADDEQEKRKDQICRRPAIPFRMFQRPIDMRPRTGIVNQHHTRDGDAAEDIERNQTIALRGHRNYPHITQMPQIGKNKLSRREFVLSNLRHLRNVRIIPMTTQSNRLVSLDVFRGITIAGMVLVNNPGSWSHIYWPLEHAEWNGWTPTDLIFPFFLFIVGVAIPLAFGKRIERGDPRRSMFLKVVYRSVIIFLLGEFLAGFPYFHLSTIRIPGVLQRIAVCYFLASIIYLLTRARTQAIIAIALLVIYQFLMTRGHAPGHYVGALSKEGSIASYIDRTVFGPHVWRQAVVYDPEGILSTMGALATTLSGVLTGYLIRDKNRTPIEKVTMMFVAGFACAIIGWCWNPWFPINKSLWTSSYVFFTAGLGGGIFPVFFFFV